VPLNCGATLAVKVTDCPTFDGFSDEVKAVVVVALLTTWLTAFDVLPGKFESPPYTALIASVPAGSVEVLKLAEPPLNAPVPSTVVPFMNETVSPSGGGAPRLEVTVAVKVTACPYVDGFGEDVSVVVVATRTT
jgi:predicted small secreted protein